MAAILSRSQWDKLSLDCSNCMNCMRPFLYNFCMQTCINFATCVQSTPNSIHFSFSWVTYWCRNKVLQVWNKILNILKGGNETTAHWHFHISSLTSRVYCGFFAKHCFFDIKKLLESKLIFGYDFMWCLLRYSFRSLNFIVSFIMK